MKNKNIKKIQTLNNFKNLFFKKNLNIKDKIKDEKVVYKNLRIYLNKESHNDFFHFDFILNYVELFKMSEIFIYQQT